MKPLSTCIIQMPRLGLTIIVFMTTLCCLCTASAQTQRYFMVNGKNIEVNSLDSQIKVMMDVIGIPGLSLAIIDNEDIVYYNAYGYKGNKSKEPVNKRTIFEGCSLSKSLLAFVAYQVVNEKKLDLDRPLYQYLEYEPLQYDQRYKLITARMVLSHASGIENHWGQNNSEQLDIVSNPGARYVYSGEGYVYLSKIIESLLGQSYEQYINDRVIDHLKLKNTSLKFTEQKGLRKEKPSNYALGHDIFGTELGKWKNLGVAPKGGNSFTAEDYAKIILAIFNSKRLSDERNKYLLEPTIQIENSPIYYGPGFEIHFSQNDTIISHGGSNTGFKGLVFYSVVKKRGFVLLANHDLGKLMAAKICAMTVGLDITPFTEGHFELREQYPSSALSLFKTYNKKGAHQMFAEMAAMKSEGRVSVNTLAVLGDFFLSRDSLILSKKILEEASQLYPNASAPFALLGDVYWGLGEGNLAHENYKKAKQLNFDLWEIESNLKECETWAAEFEKRKDFQARITKSMEAILQAENYNAWRGVKVESSSDDGGGQNVGHIDSDDWMDYNIKVTDSGTYALTLRVASLTGSQLELQLDKSVLATVDIPATNGWQNWTSLTATINLTPGDKTLRLYTSKGGFNVNWFKLSAIQLKSDGE